MVHLLSLVPQENACRNDDIASLTGSTFPGIPAASQVPPELTCRRNKTAHADLCPPPAPHRNDFANGSSRDDEAVARTSDLRVRSVALLIF